MTTINKLKKPRIALFFVQLVLFISCNQYDDTGSYNNMETSYSLAKSQLQEYPIPLLKQSDTEKNKQILNFLNMKNVTQVEFPQLVFALNKMSITDKVDIILKSKIFDLEDVNRFNELARIIKTNNFQVGIEDFESKIISLELDTEELIKYNYFMSVLKLINHLDFDIFAPSSYSAKEANIDCIIATIAFAAACVALATLEVGSGGLATAAVIIGYIAASAAWVRACN